MSRYDIPGRKLRTIVAVGWDPMLETFFMQVFRSGHATSAVWKGGSFRELPDIADLRRAVDPYADLSELTASLLVGDQDANR